MYAKVGDPKSRDGELRHQKTGKNGNFCNENLLIRFGVVNGPTSLGPNPKILARTRPES